MQMAHFLMVYRSYNLMRSNKKVMFIRTEGLSFWDVDKIGSAQALAATHALASE